MLLYMAASGATAELDKSLTGHILSQGCLYLTGAVFRIDVDIVTVFDFQVLALKILFPVTS